MGGRFRMVNRAEIDEGNASGLDSAEPATVVEGEGKDTVKPSFSGTSWIEAETVVTVIDIANEDGWRCAGKQRRGAVRCIPRYAPRIRCPGTVMTLISQEPRIDNLHN